MRLTKGVVLIVSFLFLISLSSCTSQTEPEASDDSIVIGFSQLGSESSWREKNTESVLDAAKAANFKVLYENAHQKQANQIKAIRSFIASRVDVIVFSPIVETGWDTVLTEARDAGIPVVLNDRNINVADDSLYTTFVGLDVYKQGKMAAEFLQKKFPDPNQAVKIMEIQGTRDSTPTINRHQGFIDELKDEPRFELVATDHGDFMASKGEECLRNLSQTIDLANIDVIYCHNDDMTRGVLNYLETTTFKPGEDLVIVSVDGQQDAIDALKTGKINCDIECNPNTGPKLISVIEHMLLGGEVEKQYYLEDQVFSEFDDLDDLKDRGY